MSNIYKGQLNTLTFPINDKDTHTYKVTPDSIETLRGNKVIFNSSMPNEPIKVITDHLTTNENNTIKNLYLTHMPKKEYDDLNDGYKGFSTLKEKYIKLDDGTYNCIPCIKFVFGGLAFAKRIKELIPNAILDEDAKTITFSHEDITSQVTQESIYNGEDFFLPYNDERKMVNFNNVDKRNVYTILLAVESAASNGWLNLTIGGYKGFSVWKNGEKQLGEIAYLITRKGDLKFKANGVGTVTLNYAKCGIFQGSPFYFANSTHINTPKNTAINDDNNSSVYQDRAHWRVDADQDTNYQNIVNNTLIPQIQNYSKYLYTVDFYKDCNFDNASYNWLTHQLHENQNELIGTYINDTIYSLPTTQPQIIFSNLGETQVNLFYNIINEDFEIGDIKRSVRSSKHNLSNWRRCNGFSVNKNQYPILFDMIKSGSVINLNYLYNNAPYKLYIPQDDNNTYYCYGFNGASQTSQMAFTISRGDSYSNNLITQTIKVDFRLDESQYCIHNNILYILTRNTSSYIAYIIPLNELFSDDFKQSNYATTLPVSTYIPSGMNIKVNIAPFIDHVAFSLCPYDSSNGGGISDYVYHGSWGKSSNMYKITSHKVSKNKDFTVQEAHSLTQVLFIFANHVSETWQISEPTPISVSSSTSNIGLYQVQPFYNKDCWNFVWPKDYYTDDATGGFYVYQINNDGTYIKKSIIHKNLDGRGPAFTDPDYPTARMTNVFLHQNILYCRIENSDMADRTFATIDVSQAFNQYDEDTILTKDEAMYNYKVCLQYSGDDGETYKIDGDSKFITRGLSFCVYDFNTQTLCELITPAHAIYSNAKSKVIFDLVPIEMNIIFKTGDFLPANDQIHDIVYNKKTGLYEYTGYKTNTDQYFYYNFNKKTVPDLYDIKYDYLIKVY